MSTTTTLPMSPQVEPEEAERMSADRRREAAIRVGVLAALGRPARLYRVAVVPLWENNFRVNVMTGDFNGDGKTDIIGRVQLTGRWWVAYSNGSTLTNTLYAAWDPSVNWVDAQVGDFNADGRDDISARNSATGQWLTALSNGTTGSSSVWDTWDPSVTWVDVHTGVFV